MSDVQVLRFSYADAQRQVLDPLTNFNQLMGLYRQQTLRQGDSIQVYDRNDGRLLELELVRAIFLHDPLLEFK
jgi:hypothetical protein